MDVCSVECVRCEASDTDEVVPYRLGKRHAFFCREQCEREGPLSDIIHISDARLEELIAEDVPYIDLTTHILGIGEALGAMEYYMRENCVLCCTEEVGVWPQC